MVDITEFWPTFCTNDNWRLVSCRYISTISFLRRHCCRRPRRQRAAPSDHLCLSFSLFTPLSLSFCFQPPSHFHARRHRSCPILPEITATCILAFIDAPQLADNFHFFVIQALQQVQITRFKFSVSRINHNERLSGCHHNF